MKRLTLILTAILALTMPLHAATFKAKRGISLDIWVVWPGEDKWDDADTILPFPEWRKTVKEPELRALKEAGFDFVRMPVDPSPFLSAKTKDLRDQLYASVLESAQLIEAAGLKVIVDLHWLPAGGNRSIGTVEVLKGDDLYAEYLEFVRRIATLVSKEDPQTLALEVFNEPTIDCDSDGTNDWPEKLKQSFAAARASATKTSLILSGACWGGAEGLVKLDPKEFPDNNLIWSFHSYDPFVLTHQGATWTGDFMPYVYGLPFPLHEAGKAELENTLDEIRARIRSEAPSSRVSGHLAYLDEQIAAIATPEGLKAVMDKSFDQTDAWAKAHNIDPSDIIIGEFGMIRQEYGNPLVIDGATRAAYYKAQVESAERHGFAWSMWSYGGAFGIVEGFESQPAEPQVLDMVRALPK